MHKPLTIELRSDGSHPHPQLGLYTLDGEKNQPLKETCKRPFAPNSAPAAAGSFLSSAASPCSQSSPFSAALPSSSSTSPDEASRRMAAAKMLKRKGQIFPSGLPQSCRGADSCQSREAQRKKSCVPRHSRGGPCLGSALRKEWGDLTRLPLQSVVPSLSAEPWTGLF